MRMKNNRMPTSHTWFHSSWYLVLHFLFSNFWGVLRASCKKNHVRWKLTQKSFSKVEHFLLLFSHTSVLKPQCTVCSFLSYVPAFGAWLPPHPLQPQEVHAGMPRQVSVFITFTHSHQIAKSYNFIFRLPPRCPICRTEVWFHFPFQWALCALFNLTFWLFDFLKK